MLRNLVIAVIFLSLITACGGGGGENVTKSEQKTEEADLYAEVIAIHDDVMPLMGDINNLRERIDTKLEVLEQDSLNLSAQDQELRQILDDTKATLDDADDSMMNWMREFEPIDEEMEHDQVMDQLAEEKQKIVVVKEKIESALEEANQVLTSAGI